MDKIIIKDFEVHAFHGVLAEEKKLGQKFIVSLELMLDFTDAAENDDLEKTINYAEVCYSVEEFMKENTYDLIETVANKLSIYLLNQYSIIEKIKVLIKKPWAPIARPLDYVATEVERGWSRAYVGIGSNMGDKQQNIDAAISMLNDDKTKVTAISNMYTTKPVGYLDQDDFLNCAVEVKTLLSPHNFLKFLNCIESRLKRERVVRWGPRTIDLDILFFEDRIISDKNLVIPHPRLHERMFVIEPLCDIAPYFIHPVNRKSIIEIKEKLQRLSE